jgi:hypothetical protein
LPDCGAEKERSKSNKDGDTEKRYSQVNALSPEVSRFENQESHGGIPEEIAKPMNPSEHRKPQESKNLCVKNQCRAYS